MARTTKRSDGLREKKVMIDGKRYSFYGKTEKEILKKIDEKRQELEEKAEITHSRYSKDITFEEYFGIWIENRKNSILSTTIRSHQNFLKRICDIKIDYRGHRALTDDEIHRFFEAAEGVWYYNLFVVMIQTGCRSRYGRSPSTSSVTRET